MNTAIIYCKAGSGILHHLHDYYTKWHHALFTMVLNEEQSPVLNVQYTFIVLNKLHLTNKACIVSGFAGMETKLQTETVSPKHYLFL